MFCVVLSVIFFYFTQTHRRNVSMSNTTVIMPEMEQPLADGIQLRIQKLRELLKSTKHELTSETDSQHERHLNKPLVQKRQFLKVATKQLKLQLEHELTPEETLRGLTAANNKIPLKLERDDVVDVSLAHEKLDSDIAQLQSLLTRREDNKREVEEQIRYQEELQSQLKYLKEQIQAKLEVGEQQEEPQEDEKVQRIRYKTLQKHLQYLIDTYNVDMNELI